VWFCFHLRSLRLSNEIKTLPYAITKLGTISPDGGQEELELYATAENLFDTEIVTGKGSDGLVSIDRPFLTSIGVRAAF